MFLTFKLYKVLLITLLLTITTANAEIIIHGTRIVYPSDVREVTVKVTNDGENPALVQAWIDEGNAQITPDQSQAPFVITPPITRVEPGKGQSLRVIGLPNVNSLSRSQESLFWLNILDIPPKPSAINDNSGYDNFLQLAIRSRIKLFYRPTGLEGDAASAPNKLKWQVEGNNLIIKNPTPYHVTITGITQNKLESKTEKIDVLQKGIMLKPFSEQSFPVKNPNINGMTFTTINDYGGRVQQVVK